MHPFDRATAVADDEHGHLATDLDPAWSGTTGPHGGVLAAILMRAMLAQTADSAQEPQSLLVRYDRAPATGPATVMVAVDRRGRRASQLSATLSQAGRVCVRALATFAGPFPAQPDDWSEPPPQLPAFDTLAADAPAAWWPPFTSHLEYRVVLGGAVFSGDEAITGGWLVARRPRAIDAPLLAYVADAWFPSPFVRRRGAAAVPTLDLSVHFLVGLRAPLASAPLAVRFTTRTAQRGLFIEDGTIWSADGTVLAHSRQSALRVTEEPAD